MKTKEDLYYVFMKYKNCFIRHFNMQLMFIRRTHHLKQSTIKQIIITTSHCTSGTPDTIQYSLRFFFFPTEKTNTPHKDGVGHPNLHCTQDSLAHYRQGHTLNIITRHVYTTLEYASGRNESEAHCSHSHCFMKLASDAHHT